MTREEAIAELSVLHERLSNPKDCEDGCYSWEDGLYVEAIDMAIEALQDRPTGRWIDYSDEGYVECPFCHSATNCDGNKDELHFCFSCGAKMEGGAE